MAAHDSTLTKLLPTTTFELAYTLPLLFISLFLTFSGAFFTLDRTRSFAPNYQSIPGGFEAPKSRVKWYLEGGIGGLGIGYSFGLHFSTFLALFIPAKSSSSALGKSSFIAVWILSSALTTALAGRWRWVALTLAGLTGGFVLALALMVIVHPTLLTRIVLVAIFTPIITVFTLLPLARVQHATLRLATSSIGAFGTVLAISILASIPAWANVWDRLWLNDGESWGTGQERGLSAGFCLFLLLGMLTDFLLNKKFGECPDKQWDEYLAKYTSNLPDRAGTFRPFTSVWERVFGSNLVAASSTKEMAFPPDSELRMPASPSQKLKREHTLEFNPVPGFLKKSRSNNRRIPGSKGRKEGVKFRPIHEGLSSDEEEDWDLTRGPPRPWLRTKSSSGSTTTLVDELDIEKEVAKIGKVKSGGAAPDYSDYEEDVTSINLHQREKEQGGAWSPGFLQKQRSSTTNSTKTVVEPTIPLSVPATPSLIKAIDRLAIAQKDAYGQAGPPRPGLPHLKISEVNEEGLPTTVKPKLVSPTQGPKWGEFWNDVENKIHASR